MKRVRVIPVLGIDRGRLVKTVRFGDPRYIGDPLMAIRIFNDKEVDELLVADIRASKARREPDHVLLKRMAGECFMPIGYIGGVATADQAKRIFDLGIEKVGLCTAFLENPSIVGELAGRYGSQSVMVCIDVARSMIRGQRAVGCSGTRPSRMTPEEAARSAVEEGAGEVLLHSVDREGTFTGYDLELLRSVVRSVAVPVVPLGGAGTVDHLAAAINTGASAVAASSMFVYKRNDVRSILVNYPSKQELERLVANNPGSEVP